MKFLHVSAPGFHPQGCFWKKGVQVQHTNLYLDQYLDYSVGVLLICSRILPEYGTHVPKHVAVWCFS